jgi:hypothetical protein
MSSQNNKIYHNVHTPISSSHPAKYKKFAKKAESEYNQVSALFPFFGDNEKAYLPIPVSLTSLTRSGIRQ